MTDFAADWNSVPAPSKPNQGAFPPSMIGDVRAAEANDDNRKSDARRLIAREEGGDKGAIPRSAVIDYAKDWNTVGAPEAKPEAGRPSTQGRPVPIEVSANPQGAEKPQRADKEVVHAIASGIGHAVLAGYKGIFNLGNAEERAAIVREEQEKAYQPKGDVAQATTEVLGSNYNPLNWIPSAGKVIAEKGAEHGIWKPNEAAAIEAVTAAAGPGAALKAMKGAQFFKRVEPPKPRLTYAQAQEQMKTATPQSHFDSVKEARGNGYVVTPRQISPTGTVANVYEGAAGSAKMEKLASIKNQETTNRIIATEDLGLKPGEKISDKVLHNIREKEGAAYQAVKDSGVTLKTNEAYETAVKGLAGDIKDALPGVVKTAEIDDLMKSLSVAEMSPATAITTVKVLCAHGTKNIKAGYQSPEKEALGYAQRKAADAIDSLIESNLKDAGKGELSDAYKAARIKIAKTHDIEAALNDATGNVDALALAKMADKGKPLSGGTQKVARFAKTFGNSARNVDTMKDAANFSLADVAAGVLGGTLTGPGVLAVGARPIARTIALSKIGQRTMGAK